MSICVFPNFKEITLEDKPLIDKHTKGFIPYCDFNFSNIYNWSSSRNPTQFSILNDNLVIKMKDFTSENELISFIGNNNVHETIDTLLKEYELLTLVPEDSIIGVDNDLFLIEEDEDNHDYVLSTKKLKELKGKEYKNKRKKISKLLRKYPTLSYAILDLKCDDAHKHVRDLFELWGDVKKKEYEDELEAINRLLGNHHHYELIVVGIFDKDKLVGFTTNEIFDDKHAIGSFGKADPNYEGLSVYLEHITSVVLHDMGIKYLNIEQDLGILGLRDYKLSYKPVKKHKKYRILRR